MDINEVLKKQPILLFDGECGFCNRSLLYFINHEKNKTMHFAPLKSKTGKELLAYFEIEAKTDSVILIRDHSAYIKSCAVLRLMPYMKGLWPLMIVFVIIPPFIRNFIYDMIAKRRMKFFGRVDNCALLPKEDRDRFFDL
ncbi:thiol-disulfide oxidoreductase DCC family protein [Sediminibacterium sp.]|uniref:thiol-disulfide oxidoreductase DCC family protein n=1 Tax=Sediminibacterium sp. TaxID=1917865 RepID=UPI002725F675|nr:DCC1-like thiol-disulfide oxidoreductase family protein [Sediminibacterium sp.]MDO9000270.1 DCC1-like thiol-disulfide oxidoreductase family protein [Bacteroidota bacterium]MDP3147161.1 DCC1-like thiol-disulfide oxidoreductase family protein [Bacteroidota bacterium]MDP3567310.1 DCC1-like thiol-disulfide oxidoreductase family protein [Sediminibacterium sp.]